MSAGELARITGLTSGAITSAIDRLERRDFLKRENDPRDRRRVVVRAVPRRVAKLARLFAPFAARYGELAAAYDERQLALIVDFLTRSREALRQSAQELRGGKSGTGRHRPGKSPGGQKSAKTPRRI